MPKFMGIDLPDSLEKIMKKNTMSYQGDFAYDRKELEEAAAKADTLPFRERTYLWMSRRCGTWCLKERRVYLKATAAYNIWTYYGGWRNERILAYAVEVTGLEDGKVTGNLYPLDYREHVELVKRMSELFMRKERISRTEISMFIRRRINYSVSFYTPNMCQMTAGRWKLSCGRKNGKG